MRFFSTFLAALTLCCGLAALPLQAGEAVNVNDQNVAIEGYDPVAYHVAGQPMAGNPDIRHEWHDAIWQFASVENRDLFASDPDRYAPHFGGFCAGGMSLGMVAKIDPQEWTIVDGQLFLGANPRASAYFADDTPTKIEAARANWETLGQTN